MAENKGDKGDKGSTEEALKLIAEGMGDMMKRFETVDNNMTGLSKRFDELTTPGKAPDKGEKTPGKEDKIGGIPDNLETIDRVEFLKVITGIIGEAMEEKFKDVNSSVTGIKDDISVKEIRKEVASLMKANKDYQDWVPEMKAIAEKNPGLSATKYYQLAKLDYPDKVTELSEKYKEIDGDKQKGSKASSSSFGGLTPTSGTPKGESNLKPEEAANKAYDEVFAGAAPGEAG